MTNYLGNFIKQKRGNLSLREFANLIGISHSHLDSIEKGFDPKTGKPVNISLEVLNKLAKVLDVEDLLLIYLAKIDYKECPDYFEKLADFQKKYKEFIKRNHFDVDDKNINFTSEQIKNEWMSIRDSVSNEVKKIGKNDLMLLLFKNMSEDEIIDLIRSNVDVTNDIDKDLLAKLLKTIYKSNTEDKKSELDVLFDKHKDILTEDDKETIKFIIEKRKRETDKELDGE